MTAATNSVRIFPAAPDTAKDGICLSWNKEDFPECNSTDDCYICEMPQFLTAFHSSIPERIKEAMSDKGKTVYMSLDVPDGAGSTAVIGLGHKT